MNSLIRQASDYRDIVLAGLKQIILSVIPLFFSCNEVAGNSDPISAYLTLIPLSGPIEHWSKQSQMEFDHDLFGGTPWEKPEKYRDASAVLNADRIQTPLLIMHNERDNNIQWRQGVELFMALRRLNKRVWMLQYDNGGHSVRNKDAIDFTIRLTQFFNYFLRSRSAPKWLTSGILAKERRFENGLRLMQLEM